MASHPSSRARRRADDALAQIARRQFNVFGRAQAIDVGVRASTVDARRRSGRYVVMQRGVLREAASTDSWQSRAMAALLVVGGESVLCRLGAARAHDLDVPEVPGPIDLLVRTRSFPGSTPRGVRVHRTNHLTEEDRTSVGALRTTTVTRTVVDLAGQLGPVALRRTVADAVRRNLTDATGLRAMAARLGRVRGKRRLLAIVDELSPLDAQCRSELETMWLRLMAGAGLPPTAMNHPVTDVNGDRRYIDAVYLPQMQPVELDSERYHGLTLDRNDDRLREDAITSTGRWRPFLRFDWDDVVNRPEEVIEAVRRALHPDT